MRGLAIILQFWIKKKTPLLCSSDALEYSVYTGYYLCINSKDVFFPPIPKYRQVIDKNIIILHTIARENTQDYKKKRKMQSESQSFITILYLKIYNNIHLKKETS